MIRGCYRRRKSNREIVRKAIEIRKKYHPEVTFKMARGSVKICEKHGRDIEKMIDFVKQQARSYRSLDDLFKDLDYHYQVMEISSKLGVSYERAEEANRIAMSYSGKNNSDITPEVVIVAMRLSYEDNIGLSTVINFIKDRINEGLESSNVLKALNIRQDSGRRIGFKEAIDLLDLATPEVVAEVVRFVDRYNFRPGVVINFIKDKISNGLAANDVIKALDIRQDSGRRIGFEEAIDLLGLLTPEVVAGAVRLADGYNIEPSEVINFIKDEINEGLTANDVLKAMIICRDSGESTGFESAIKSLHESKKQVNKIKDLVDRLNISSYISKEGIQDGQGVGLNEKELSFRYGIDGRGKKTYIIKGDEIFPVIESGGSNVSGRLGEKLEVGAVEILENSLVEKVKDNSRRRANFTESLVGRGSDQGNIRDGIAPLISSIGPTPPSSRQGSPAVLDSHRTLSGATSIERRSSSSTPPLDSVNNSVTDSGASSKGTKSRFRGMFTSSSKVKNSKKLSKSPSSSIVNPQVGSLDPSGFVSVSHI